MPEKENPGTGGAVSGGMLDEHVNHNHNDNHSQEQNGNRDKPLVLRLDFRPFASDLQDAVGCRLTPTEMALIFTLADSEEVHSYSRSAAFYDRPRRYQNGLFTRKKVVGAVDRLARMGWLENWVQSVGVRGRQSTASATPELVDLYGQVIGGDKPALLLPRETVILKDENKILVDYRDTAQARSMRRGLERYNEALGGIDVSGAKVSPVVRIFNRSFDRAGRFYCHGDSWQNIKSSERSLILLDGESTVELDFVSIHPTILYGERGLTPPPDCYDIEGYPRKAVKRATLILLNALTERQAIGSIVDTLDPAIACPRSTQAHHAARDMVAKIKLKHAPISDAFGSDAGARLMSMDAKIMANIIGDLLCQGIVPLCIHDSVIVPASKASVAREVMAKAANDVLGFDVAVSLKS